MEISDIRKTFEEFVGTERYLNFLATICCSNKENSRLKFKQELEWEKFVSEYGLGYKTYQEIWSLFQYCHLHQVELEQDHAEIIYGTRRSPTKAERRTINENYPYANVVAYGPCWVEDAKTKEVLYCSKCREIYGS
ncbi:hypothetical protein ACJJIQ_13900 [Microbulbifer sp. ANSA003]|uniref:hypothetical protein n=1 Tax=unclassified Microbulbifer TaxID=2619833 RepID=UPI0040398D8D